MLFSYMLKPVSDLSMDGSADVATFLEFQTVSDLFPTTFLDCPAETGFSYTLKPVSILSMDGSADIATFLQFQKVSDLFQISVQQKRYFPTCSNLFQSCPWTDQQI